ncbi:hypothetical protein FVE85_9607 [Porphyridium purpureum]|uniref:Uncharacterized protein n=1 Tax=Porphyridium purpureum TaxID=35688 RepID=A0A5J4YJA6_PORPP|nr:hypothetical protein FVE85_9607 [Porphyridium purpureum]|eukprot:POR1472..scf267_23
MEDGTSADGASPAMPPEPNNAGLDARQMWQHLQKHTGEWHGIRSVCAASGRVLVEVGTFVEVVPESTSAGGSSRSQLVWTTWVQEDTTSSPAVATVRLPTNRKSSGAAAARVDRVGANKSETWSSADVEDLGVVFEDGSFSLGPAEAGSTAGEQFLLQHGILQGEMGMRVRVIHAFDYERRLVGITICRERTRMNVAPAGSISPAAWRSPIALIKFTFGRWEGSGVMADERSGRLLRIQSVWELRLERFGEVELTSSLQVGAQNGDREESRAASTTVRGREDENVLMFPSTASHMVALSGGILVSQPLQMFRGTRAAIELFFLVRPGYRRRLIRFYNAELDWTSTAYLTERMVG